ncbi:MAG: hypothetical protein RLZZ450_3408 [Pseudomonadota bacterium]|jgi:protocatechuate 3,4-dioxygenase beta subunit
MTDHDHDAAHHQGLSVDLALFQRTTQRRTILRWMAVATLAPFVGCGSSETSGDDTSGDGGTGSGSTDTTAAGTCSVIPEETAGPYPGDGSNGVNALVLSGIVRSDIRASIGTASGTAAGVPLTIKLTLVNTNDGCNKLAGYAVYLWHCDRAGLYSLYSQGVTDQNYLRGVQETDDAGTVTFTSIFPACYSGRWPHIHFEIYPSVSSITRAGNKIKTSQLALPVEACNAVFATDGYSASVRNLSQISLASDNVFSDGTSLQLPTITGNVTDGYTVNLTVGIAD